jgi:hypothetical protein
MNFGAVHITFGMKSIYELQILILSDMLIVQNCNLMFLKANELSELDM